MKKTLTYSLGAFFLLSTLLSTAYAGVGKLSWTGKNTWTYNQEITGDKPGDQWDSQLTDQEANPFKFVLHKGGGNPEIWVRIDDTVSTSSALQNASDTRVRFEGRGIEVNAIQEKEIGGLKVFIVSGLDKAKNVRYGAAVFARPGTKRAYLVELKAPEKDFSTYEPAFMGMVQTIKLLPVQATVSR